MFDRHLVHLGHMVARRTHAVNELAVIGQQQQPGGVLVEPPDCLNPLHRAFLRTQAQRRRQQRVDAGVGRGFLRALGRRRLVQQHIGLFMVRPVDALHPKSQALRFKFSRGLRAERRGRGVGRLENLNQPLLDQAGADPPRSKALGIKNVL